MKKALNILEKILYTLLIVYFSCLIVFIAYCKMTEIISIYYGDEYEPKFSVYMIVSKSMIPKYKVYDLVVNRRVDSPESLTVDDVITFKSTSLESLGLTVTHRITDILVDENDSSCFTTKGDANYYTDTSCAKAQNVIGKVVFKIPFVGFIGTPPGILLFISSIVAGTILKLIRKCIIKAKQ